MSHTISKFAVAAVAAALIGLAAGDALAQSKIFKAETANPGSENHAVAVVLGKIFQEKLGISTQINDSQTLTRSSMKLGRAQIDWMALPPPIYFFMTKGMAMYKKKLSKEAPKAAANIRTILSYSAVVFHGVTFASSGIKTFKDIKGKRVFTGPPSGAAGTTQEALIRVITGYEPNKDYKAIRLRWGSGLQAMMDGKLDVFMRPGAPGSALIQQLGLSKDFRLLDAGDAVTTDAFKKWLKVPGRVPGTIPANTYKGQVNADQTIRTGGVVYQIAVRKGIDDDTIYKMTKAVWDNLDDIHKTAAVLKVIKKETPFTGMIAPLHPGAVKYYKEVGIDIPKRLLPPAS